MSATIAFDLDGTLIASDAHIHAAVSAALSDLNLPAITPGDTRSFVGHGLPPLLDKVLAHIGAPAGLKPGLHTQVMQHYVSIPTDPATVYPGVADALSCLQMMGHRLTICTNKPEKAARAALRDVGLLSFFDLIVAGDSLPQRKPDPAMLRAAQGLMLVGDSEVDAETAQRADLPFVLFTQGYRKLPVQDLPHSATFDHFDQLPDLIAGML